MTLNACLVLAGTIPVAFSLSEASILNQNINLSTVSLEGNPQNANGILNFKGIPYAQPPVGNLRWHSPQAITSWQGTLNTTAFGDSCYASSTEEPYFTPPSENCLYLNVWTGAQQASEQRPVMVWIHGGGFQFGSAA